MHNAFLCLFDHKIKMFSYYQFLSCLCNFLFIRLLLKKNYMYPEYYSNYVIII